MDLLAVQGTLKSLLQHHSSKASIFQHSVFFMVQLSHPYMTTGKTVAFTIWTLVSKMMSLLFNFLASCLLYGLVLTTYVDTGKAVALAIWNFVGKVMSLLFNMLSRLVIAFLPRSRRLISWLQSPSKVILEPKKINSVTVSFVPPSSCHDMMELETMIFVF